MALRREVPAVTVWTKAVQTANLIWEDVMTKDKYVRYGAAIAAGALFAVWIGLPPALLLFLLICPLMMFFMMRGMHGGAGGHNEHHAPPEAQQPDIDATKPCPELSLPFASVAAQEAASPR